jgi:hypothetical protein
MRLLASRSSSGIQLNGRIVDRAYLPGGGHPSLFRIPATRFVDFELHF